MAQRGVNKTRWATHCCREYQEDAIAWGIRILLDRAVSWNHPDLSVTDVLRIFVPQELQELAVVAYQKLLVAGVTSVSYTANNGLMINLHLRAPEFAPLQAKFVSNDCPERAKLDEWVAWRYQRGMEWATVKAVWRGLQKACHRDGTNQLKTVRYLWPTVMTLLEAGGQQETADKLRDARPPDWVPPLPQQLREAMKVTTGVVAGTLLLPAEHGPKPPVRATLSNADGVPRQDLGWGEKVRPL